ncbi:hypothetical protein Tsubulata_001114 [Turnera subulata]|uniref:Aluminum-activated malate transporter n=1 Tax=Turnera subulata TaxID=218843 RepID=A0A9Q0FZR2_9ROSI|nr:hypothetical protein Tsubulata_001114 [Turnera subulata]
MAEGKKPTSGVEWRINVEDGSSRTLFPEAGPTCRLWVGLKGLMAGLVSNVWSFLVKAWELGVDDPRKVIHCLKVGMALTVVSLFYYMRPLYEGVGGNAMWAIMTVVVVFENTVGATVSKSLNRVFATTLAGFLAFGVHWVAGQSGEKLEPVIIGSSVFLLASAATFSRFIPSVKQRFDYGAMIFILTFSLVTVSGYRVDKLFKLAQERVSTIIIGTSLCVLVTMLICPIWAGQELHFLIIRNMEKLANSLEGCIMEYFNPDGDHTEGEKQPDKKLLGYKCVLGSKAAEESMANFARWEPAHGRFNFKHPWQQYLKIGASMRSCAYYVEALTSCIDSETQAPEQVKKHMSNNCRKVSSNSCSVIKELVKTMKTMKKSSTIDLLVEEMNSTVQDLQNDLKHLSNAFNQPESPIPEDKKTETNTTTSAATTIPLIEVIPIVTFASLLAEVAARVQDIADAVEELGKLAEFKVADDEKPPQQNQADSRVVAGQV